MRDNTSGSWAPADLYALLLKIRPLGPGSIMPFTGQQVHGALMRWLKAAAPELADELHAGNKRRLFTVSSLRFPSYPKGTFWAERGNVHLPLRPEQTYTVRLTFLRRDLFAHFYQACTRFESLPSSSQEGARPPFVQIGKQLFLLEEVLLDNDDPSGWCGFQRLPGLVEQAKAEQGTKITLEFASLTTFSSKRLTTPAPPAFCDAFWQENFSLLPYPILLFGGLARRWGDIAPPELAGVIEPERIERYIQRGGVTVGDFQVTRHQVHFPAFTQPGFVGRCAFHLGIPQEEEEGPAPSGNGLALPQQLQLLAHLAFYCGVGYKTTMGMGQTRPVSQVHQRAPGDERVAADGALQGGQATATGVPSAG